MSFSLWFSKASVDLTCVFNQNDASVHLMQRRCSSANDAGVQIKRHIR